MKIFQLLQPVMLTGVIAASSLMLAACDPVPPPHTEDTATKPYQVGGGSDKTMDHNGETSGSSDPARRE
ncbi:MAG TPA: hypothetical protein VLE43_11305 [Candidatus Saccharimonadia bacterium]|nr:hypothetical protein [Candidatus Saccharimonadia bacterium]